MYVCSCRFTISQQCTVNHWFLLLEDLLKLKGIAAWFCSVYTTDRDTMTRVLHSARHIKPGIAEPDTILMKLQHRERKERFTVQGIIDWEIASKCITAHSQCTKFIWQTFWCDQVWSGNLWIQYRQSGSVSTSKPVSIDALSQWKQTSRTSLLKASLCEWLLQLRKGQEVVFWACLKFQLKCNSLKVTLVSKHICWMKVWVPNTNCGAETDQAHHKDVASQTMWIHMSNIHKHPCKLSGRIWSKRTPFLTLIETSQYPTA